MSKPQSPRGVLFDMDGVLVQTEPLKAQAHAATTQQWGGNVSPEFYATVMGQPVEAIMHAFLSAGQVTAEPARYLESYEAIYRQLLETHLAATPGVVELLGQLKQRGYRLGLVTSDYAATRDQILTRLGLHHFFEVLVARDDVARIKPAPDAYLAGLERLALPPTAVVAIEDSESGVQAALRAGLRVLTFRHPFNLRHNFSLAYQIFESFQDYQWLTRLIETALN